MPYTESPPASAGVPLDTASAGHPSVQSLASTHQVLRTTGRGKHVGRFSYYHVALVAERPAAVRWLRAVQRRLSPVRFPYNVVKIDRHSRLTFLRYQDFKTPFPELRAALSCDLARQTSRLAHYSELANPPLLHRKELLLPADCSIVLPSARLTSELEQLGAFADPTRIGNRHGWSQRLSELGLRIDGYSVIRT